MLILLFTTYLYQIIKLSLHVPAWVVYVWLGSCLPEWLYM